MRSSFPPTELRVGIVGFGPRGLIVLERLVAFARKYRERSVKAFVYDPNEPGVGIHSPDQPGYLKLNTVAGQVTMFPGDIGAEDGVSWDGASLFEWCKQKDARFFEDHAPEGTPPRPVAATDFLPRSRLGDYLAWFQEELLRRAPPSMKIAINRSRVVGLRRSPGEEGTELVTEDGAAVSVDRTFITIGHGIEHSADRVEPADNVIPAYPASRALQRVRERDTVRILGVGLSAMDLMAGVVDRWGGRFEKSPEGKIDYIRSGNEGRLEFVTRSGLPYRGRPVLRGARHARPGLIFNEPALDALEGRHGRGRVDFEAHVEPLILAEMMSAYHATREADADVASEFAATWKSDAPDEGLRGRRKGEDPFDPRAELLLYLPSGLHADDHQRWFREFLAADIRACRAGLSRDPCKAAFEVWRDLRETIRRVIDRGLLTASSHRRFFDVTSPMINRHVAGPQVERIEELACLIDEGIAKITIANRKAAGTNALQAPPVHVFAGHAPPSGVSRRDNGLFADMHANGLIRVSKSADTLDGPAVTPEGQVIRPDGSVDTRLWIFGPAAEGALYYNHYVPSPEGYGRAQWDAHNAVKRCFQAPEAIETAATAETSRPSRVEV